MAVRREKQEIFFKRENESAQKRRQNPQIADLEPGVFFISERFLQEKFVWTGGIIGWIWT